MKKLFFAAAAAVAFLTVPLAQAQTTTVPAANTRTSATAADGWDWPSSPANAAVATTDADDAMMRSSGVLVAPGMSSSPYRGTSTDYNGRPVARRKSARPRSVRITSPDPVMASSGVMLAPGMNTAPHRAASTDYNGRPVHRAAAATMPVAAPAAGELALGNGW